MTEIVGDDGAGAIPFNPAHARSTFNGGWNVTHKHFEYDYGGHASVASVADGDKYWDWHYDQFGGIAKEPNVAANVTTNVTNCTSYAYHTYKDANNVSLHWVDSGVDAEPYWLVLNVAANNTPLSDNSNVAIGDGYRADNVDHVWFFVGCGCDRYIYWKNNSSPKFKLSATMGNDAPKFKLPNAAGGFTATWFDGDNRNGTDGAKSDTYGIYFR